MTIKMPLMKIVDESAYDDATSYQPGRAYQVHLVVKEDKALQDELAAWDEASDEALENFEKDFPPQES